MTTMFPPSAKPYVLPVRRENIPALLRQEHRWVCWKAGPLKKNGKFAKFPSDPSTAHRINGRDPANWRPWTEVLDAYDRGTADGVGFALSDQHPVIVDDTPLYVTVIDLDQCGATMDEWQVLWRELGQPFVEMSPSGNGLHMWALGRSPLRGGNAREGRELYSGGRFMTVTGVGARGILGECPGLFALERRWFPGKDAVEAPPALAIVGDKDVPSNLLAPSSGSSWFDRLPPHKKDACLAEMLRLPAVIALADTPDGASEPNWRTIVASCARSGASDAYNLCRAWAQTSPRFDPDNFDLRWRSYRRG